MRLVIKSGSPLVYVCNCNGIRERQVRAAIEAGATRPAEVFRAHGCKVQCARCVCEMREMIDQSQEVMKLAAE
jgi:bacterioferritin-associated ferredoxin